MHNTAEEQASTKTPFSTWYLKNHYRLHKKALFEQITACTLTSSSPAQPGQPSAVAHHLPAFRKSPHSLHRQTILMTPTLPVNQLMKQDCFSLLSNVWTLSHLKVACSFLLQGLPSKNCPAKFRLFPFFIFIQSCRNTLSPWQCQFAWWKSKSSFEAAECLLWVTMAINVGRGGGFTDGNCCCLVEMF